MPPDASGDPCGAACVNRITPAARYRFRRYELSREQEQNHAAVDNVQNFHNFEFSAMPAFCCEATAETDSSTFLSTPCGAEEADENIGRGS